MNKRRVTHYVIRESADDGELCSTHQTPAAVGEAVQRRLEAIGERIARGGCAAVDFEISIVIVDAKTDQPVWDEPTGASADFGEAMSAYRPAGGS